ncbi:flavin-containing monooxygenase 2 [Glossina fuscipes fuscipes]
MEALSVCVVGAGMAGLSALKNSLQSNLNATCFEQSTHLGGTWFYQEEQDVAFGENVHSSMYRDLRTNLPKEIMGYLDFTYSKQSKESFISSDEVLKFLNSYADHFHLRDHIKFQHKVLRIRPYKNKWEVLVSHNISHRCKQHLFDRVFVCNGHYTKPQYPKTVGMSCYKGIQMHSHLYRTQDKFKAQKVLIIGAGPSGIDLTNHISKVANCVYLSHHLSKKPNTDFMRNVIQKPNVKQFIETGAIFEDNSSEEFDIVVYCTGYQYSFPFLSSECGIFVHNNHVQPLYKHCININYPTMAIIGLPYAVIPSQVFDLQVRFSLKFFKNELKLPSREDMLTEMEKDNEERQKDGLRERDAHRMGAKQFCYYKDLSKTANLIGVKPVIEKIMQDCGQKYIYELQTYREYYFEVLDDENFIKLPLK